MKLRSHTAERKATIKLPCAVDPLCETHLNNISGSEVESLERFEALVRSFLSSGDRKEMSKLYWKIAVDLDSLYALRISNPELYEQYRRVALPVYESETLDRRNPLSHLKIY